MIRGLSSSTLFPYTTLFRSRSLDFAKKRECYAAVLDERLASGGPAPALQLLDRLAALRSEEHTSELQSQSNIVCRLLLEKNNIINIHALFNISPPFVIGFSP